MTKAGLRTELEAVVALEDTAEVVGSGDVPVLATPRLVALFEAATVRLLLGQLVAADTSVGTHVEIDHLAASPVGARVIVAAELTELDGRRALFDVRATAPDGTLLATGKVRRAIVNRDTFMSRLADTST
ncbi:thioesterase family protein [Actinomadura rupiterrae]|uniref:thioesterase family protein n=1 Tax=Actinomadura rupiterrae TaxID=559627 RepID=UPI0020A4B18B|nr:hotdog domain-containing protein [Actinomadura rupiterrae]MCP2343420.1 putative thioesterase [Actinomadura rupiterrae]